MRKYLFVALSSFLAGCCIVFGATCYLMCTIQGTYALKVLGASLFGIGLFTIIHYGLWLYTGKVGYVLDNIKKPSYLLKLLICLLANLVGVILTSLLLKASGMTDIVGKGGNSIHTFCKALAESKQNEKWYEVLILGFFCGIMIYLAVDGHKKCEYPLGKVLFAFMPIVLFILCGFEHVVANAAYYTYGSVFSGKVVLWFILMAIGDGLGSIAFDGLVKGINYLGKEKAKNEEDK